VEDNQYRPVPPWLTLNADTLKVNVSRLPNADEADTSINVQLIVEFYSR
jgi:small subunit ribosomal protein S4